MTRFNKLTALLLALVLLVGTFSVTAFAAEGLTLTVETVSEEKQPGDEVTLAVNMTGNPGVTNFELYVNYDHDRLELKSINSSYINDDEEEVTYFPGSLSQVNLNKDYNGKSCGFITSARANTYTKENRTIFSVTFKVKDGAPGGMAKVSLINQKFCNVVDKVDNLMDPILVEGGIMVASGPCVHEYEAAQDAGTKVVTYTCGKCSDAYTVGSEGFAVEANDSVMNSESLPVTENKYVATLPAGTTEATVKTDEEVEMFVGDTEVTYNETQTGTEATVALKDNDDDGQIDTVVTVKSPADDKGNSFVLYVLSFRLTDSGYSVVLEASKEEVSVGEEFTVALKVNGAPYNQVDAKLTFDTALFTYVQAAGGVVEVTGNTISVALYGTEKQPDTTVTTLTFKSNSVTETKEGSFTLTTARVGNGDEAMSGNAYEVKAKTNDTVQIVPKFAVIFNDKDGNQLGNTLSIPYNGSVSAEGIPAAPEVDYHDFTGWKSGETTYTSEQVAAQKVTSAVTYTAVYTPKTYSVTLGEGLSGANMATYGTDYIGQIENYDGENYDYTIEGAAVNADGTFTVAGEAITGNQNLSVSKMIKGVTISLTSDYIGGKTLVLVTGSAGNYSYNGVTMHKTPVYGENTYAVVVDGETTEAAVKALLHTTTAAVEMLTANSTDVNATGLTDINDAQAVYNCYQISDKYPIATYMATYLRSDVNGDKVVDVADVNLVLEARS